MPTTYEAPASIGSLTKNKIKLKTSKIMCLVLSKGLKKKSIYQHLELHQLDFKLSVMPHNPLKKNFTLQLTMKLLLL